MKCLKSDSTSADSAVQCLRKGGVCIIPTDTVYGFSGIVDINTEYKTDERIRQIKGRSETKPLIQLIAHPQDLRLYTNDHIPQELISLWPGPLTIIVKIKKESPLSSMFPTVAFRCPGDQWLRNVIEECGAPLFSTSVNRSGSPVLECIGEIEREFESEVDLIVQDGDKTGSLPSTIVSVLDGKVNVLRQGAVRI